MGEKDLLEELAALEHEQWIEWSKAISVDERISEERLRRWHELWVPYENLPGESKEDDRIYARKVLECIHEISGTAPHVTRGDIVEVTWLDAGMCDRLRPEELESALGLLLTKSYGVVYCVTDHYIILLQNATQPTRDPAGDGNSVFRIPLGTVQEIRVLEMFSQNGGKCEKDEVK